MSRIAPLDQVQLPARSAPVTAGAVLGGVARRALLGLIRAYQLILSPLLGPACRYEPSCSEYAHQAVERHGPLRGTWLAVKRLARCHPFGGSGHDPVP